MKKEFEKKFRQFQQDLNPVIKKMLLEGVNSEHQSLVSYQINCGGKRLRPILAILTYRMLGGRKKEILWPAAALEILHNYTLILDDIIDHSIKRRGKETVWYKFGISIAELISMDYAASIFNIPSTVKNYSAVLMTISQSLKIITQGQILDILFEATERKNEPYVKQHKYDLVRIDDYYNMISSKTAVLISAACVVGGLVAGACQDDLENVKQFGFNLGMAFQIKDDILDIFGDEKKFGKQIGKDIEEHKQGNIVISLAMSELNKKDRNKFFNILKNKKVSKINLNKAVSLINKTKAFRRAEHKKLQFITKAKINLDKLPCNKWQQMLIDLTDYLSDRLV